MGRYLIDSNVIVDYASEKFTENAMFVLADIISDRDFKRIPNLKIINPFNL